VSASPFSRFQNPIDVFRLSRWEEAWYLPQVSPVNTKDASRPFRFQLPPAHFPLFFHSLAVSAIGFLFRRRTYSPPSTSCLVSSYFSRSGFSPPFCFAARNSNPFPQRLPRKTLPPPKRNTSRRLPPILPSIWRFSLSFSFIFLTARKSPLSGIWLMGIFLLILHFPSRCCLSLHDPRCMK